MTTLKITSNQHLMVGTLCLLFAITGGVGGYNLKSRMQDSGKSELTTDLPVLKSSLSATQSSNNTITNCTAQTQLNTDDATLPLTPSSNNPNYTQRIKQLISTIQSIASQQDIALDIDTQVKTETDFISIVDHTPELIKPLISVYIHMADGQSKEFLRSLLSTTASRQIQEDAMVYLQNGNIEFRSDWLSLLRDTGVHTSKARDKLFNIIPSLDQPQSIRDAILAVTPAIVSANERFAVVNQLGTYLHHSDELVRSAAIESLSKWADNSHASIIEQALIDSTQQVRYAAISAAHTSAVRSDYIEAMLVDLMINPNEDLQMRIHSYNALSNYSLQGQHYHQYYQFHQQFLAIENSGEAKG